MKTKQIQLWNPLTAMDDKENLIDLNNYKGKNVFVQLSRNTDQDGFDFPIRAKKNQNIILSPHVDWMERCFPTDWQSLLLAVMAAAQRHLFLSTTDRWTNFAAMMAAIGLYDQRTIAVPGDGPFEKELVKLNKSRAKFDLSNPLRIVAHRHLAREDQTPVKGEQSDFQVMAQVPWPPQNIVFCFEAQTDERADQLVPFLYNLKQAVPGIRTAAIVSPKIDIYGKHGMQETFADIIRFSHNPRLEVMKDIIQTDGV
jgi:hypothetical protein